MNSRFNRLRRIKRALGRGSRNSASVHLSGASAKYWENPFDTSATYWENRYRSGGNSGAGSYNRLAEFKAEVLNDFVAANAIKSVIEFGSGDGAQLELADYPSYVGVDVSPAALEATRANFRNDPTKQFIHTSEVKESDRADAALSLDVIYHLVEDDVFDSYMRSLFNAANRYVIVYSSNVDEPGPSPHVRHREFTKWIKANRPDFRFLEKIPNRYPWTDKDPGNTSFADFYIFERVEIPLADFDSPEDA